MKKERVIKIVAGLFLVSVFSIFLPARAYALTGYFNNGLKTSNITIPDNDSKVCQDINLTGSPAGAIITSVYISYEIRHTYRGDLVVWLTSYFSGAWHDYDLSNREGGSADDIVEQRTLHTWDGGPLNNEWFLCAQDFAGGDEGYIDMFYIKFHLNAPNNWKYLAKLSSQQKEHSA